MRVLPLRHKKKVLIEEDPVKREATKRLLPIPDGPAEFRDGYRECVELFALHAPNRRQLRRILEEHGILLEETCMRTMTRENVARFEGYRQAMKDMGKRNLIR